MFDFLEQIYEKKPVNWLISYPKNSYNETTISILKEYKCVFGLTYNPKLAKIDSKSNYEIPRFDTNDFPVTNNSEQNKWTKLMLNYEQL